MELALIADWISWIMSSVVGDKVELVKRLLEGWKTSEWKANQEKQRVLITVPNLQQQSNTQVFSVCLIDWEMTTVYLST